MNNPRTDSQRLTKIFAATLSSFVVFFTAQNVDGLAVVSVTQKIREISCVLTTVVKDDGAFGYVLSPRCGTLVLPPTHPDRAAWAQSYFGLQTPDVVAKLLFGPEVVHLDATTQPQPDGGYVLLTYEGLRYTFELAGESGLAQPRHFEILAVRDTTVTLRFWPEGRQVTLQLDKPQRIQIAYDAAPDIVLTLIQLNADGTALVRVQFPVRAETAPGDTKDAVIATVLLFGAIAVVLHEYLYGWMLRKRGHPPSEWWAYHTHEPLK
jgi:hypothetical protein